jgi:hypothetical protein
LIEACCSLKERTAMRFPASVYGEVIDYIAENTPPPETLLSFRVSDATRREVDELIRREKAGELSRDEAEDLHHFRELHFMIRAARARVRRALAAGARAG